MRCQEFRASASTCLCTQLKEFIEKPLDGQGGTLTAASDSAARLDPTYYPFKVRTFVKFTREWRADSHKPLAGTSEPRPQDARREDMLARKNRSRQRGRQTVGMNSSRTTMIILRWMIKALPRSLSRYTKHTLPSAISLIPDES